MDATPDAAGIGFWSRRVDHLLVRRSDPALDEPVDVTADVSITTPSGRRRGPSGVPPSSPTT